MFGRDSDWFKFSRRYSDDEAEEKYKEASLKRATIFFILAAFSFVLWIFVELVLLITKLL